ncbi:hypothetical protein FOXG_13980 [Fusarium oxysporum f. sp. lycopersici 4287]|uniref:Uncharacterized protein n=2 Tax=Fusarium oxysporum TaxID=5507 RepID=A0A0J9VXZ4_FUSO4|nr:hypothetical protein FOXG_12560 [Fusarium oxysporum f. sp. lycopersici 4287]XP_018253465.1 hypothetical protein FOXG_13980 [Fusarium oxysporum f. sp. lycopersici 4287]KNB13972.1 hypothetical protein FOXG_12560 [Fusarium oxysporum f. sp. lycopersici 4287]KNB15420.1 hypothetical protein FOXG_13980 [Fusarium oxysporum f. sp. lycopersici 4287]
MCNSQPVMRVTLKIAGAKKTATQQRNLGRKGEDNENVANEGDIYAAQPSQKRAKTVVESHAEAPIAGNTGKYHQERPTPNVGHLTSVTQGIEWKDIPQSAEKVWKDRGKSLEIAMGTIGSLYPHAALAILPDLPGPNHLRVILYQDMTMFGALDELPTIHNN